MTTSSPCPRCGAELRPEEACRRCVVVAVRRFERARQSVVSRRARRVEYTWHRRPR